jgi:hypothetical protein
MSAAGPAWVVGEGSRTVILVASCTLASSVLLAATRTRAPGAIPFGRTMSLSTIKR